MTPNSKIASTAHNPDLDWSQVRETVLMLNLAVAQIERAMRDGDDSVNTLAESFTSMIGNAQVIQSATNNMQEGQEKQTILEHCSEISARMQQAIMAFQFYDKLSQRVTHVSNSLASLADLVSHPAHLYNPHEWRGLQEKIKSGYTIESDRGMFEAILSGATVEEALSMMAGQEENRVEGDNSIELF